MTFVPRAVRRRVGAPARGNTLMEIIIVFSIMTLVMAFAAPRLLASDAFGTDQQAKTTAAAALDAVMGVYAQDVTRREWDPTAVAAELARYEPGGELDPDGDGTTGTTASPGDPLTPPTGAALPHQPAAPDVAKTTLERANPDIAVAPTEAQRKALAQAAGQSTAAGIAAYRPTAEQAASAASTDLTIASVGAYRTGSGQQATAWVVGAAVWAPSSRDPQAGTCWMGQRRLDAPSGAPVETYYAFPVTGNDPADPDPARPDADQCSGHVAARLDFTALSTGTDGTAGRSWGNPLLVAAADITAAAS